MHWPLDEDQRVWYSQGEPLLTAGLLVVVGGERSSSTRRSFRIDTCPRIRCQKVLSRMSRTLEGNGESKGMLIGSAFTEIDFI